MSLAANGDHRAFYYEQPRSGVVQAGVRPGTLYFDGVTDGRQYSGTAYVFSTKCGATGFPVAGPVSPDSRQVILYGQSPVINALSCQIMGYHNYNDTLAFNFVGTAPVPAPVQVPVPVPAPVYPPQQQQQNGPIINNNITINNPPPIISNNNNNNLTPSNPQ
jgi:hypothetical protein